MRLNEIAPNSKINLSLNVQGQIFQFNTKAVMAIGDNLLVEPIMQDGKTVGFNNHTVQVLYANDERTPLVWQNATVQLVKYKRDVFHQITAQGPAAILNRRDGEREPVNVKGLATGTDFHEEVLIQDISPNGISFISEKPLPGSRNIRVNFKDLEYDFNLSVNVCWTMNPKNTTRYIYGCQIVSRNIRIEAYIHAKKRQKGEQNDN